MKKTSHNSLINGIASDYLTIDDRSIHYGDGLFETLLSEGRRLYYWLQHYRRLQRSCARLKINCPPEEALLHDISRLLDENKSAARAVKIIVSRGAGKRGYRFSSETSANRLVLTSAIDTGYSSLLSGNLSSGNLYHCQQQVSINKNLAGLKHLNRLENVMARAEWRDDHIEGLMLNAHQHVIEGTMSNLFAVKDGNLFTPDLELSGVEGIMRELIIDIAENGNIKTSVTDLTLDDLTTMDELFICNSLMGIRSIDKFCEWQSNGQVMAEKILSELSDDKENYVQVV